MAGNYERTPEHRAQMKATQLAKADYYRQKAKERWADPEFRDTMNRTLTRRTRKVRSDTMKRLWKDPIMRKKMIECSRKKLGARGRGLVSMKAKERWADSEFRKKIGKVNAKPEVKLRRSKAISRNWRDPDFRKKATLGIRKAQSKPEYKDNMSKATAMEKNPRWRGGKSFEPYGTDFNEKFKSRVRKFYENTCQICLTHQSDLSYKLHCHHVDYNKTNNVIENCVPLCRSCHTKTNSNRKKWIEFFKKKRKKD